MGPGLFVILLNCSFVTTLLCTAIFTMGRLHSLASQWAIIRFILCITTEVVCVYTVPFVQNVLDTTDPDHIIYGKACLSRELCRGVCFT